MKVKTSELEGAALDWAVAKAEKRTDLRVDEDGELVGQDDFDYSTDWAQGGPIIEREKITVRFWENEPFVHAYMWNREGWLEGPTPLIAAMRCFVASKLGEEVEIPEEVK
jgi:hypothetical protein